MINKIVQNTVAITSVKVAALALAVQAVIATTPSMV